MTQDNLINFHPVFTYGSPRYHSYIYDNYIYEEDNFLGYDIINGTYDKYFPLYSITSNDEPKLSVTMPNGTVENLRGDVEIRLNRDKYGSKTIGWTDYRHPYVNQALDQKEIKYSDYLHTNLNPAWCHIQINTNDSVSFNGYLIRTLGYKEVTKAYLSLDYKEDFLQFFPKGIIVHSEDDSIPLKAIQNTYNLPSIESSDWEVISDNDTPFNADYYSINESGNTQYINSIQDRNRSFRVEDSDTTLISWNMSVYIT